MCSRYELSVTPRQLACHFRLAEDPEDLARAIVRPTDRSLVVVRHDGGRRAVPMGFGLSVSWSDRPLLHARAETVAQKSAFRPYLQRRCLVPASAYFEWRADGRRKLMNRIAPPSGGLMAFAGLHDGERFMIVTCAPTPSIAHIHDRMPVILSDGAEEAWLDGSVPFGDVAGLLMPCAASAVSYEEEKPPQPRQASLFG